MCSWQGQPIVGGWEGGWGGSGTSLQWCIRLLHRNKIDVLLRQAYSSGLAHPLDPWPTTCNTHTAHNTQQTACLHPDYPHAHQHGPLKVPGARHTRHQVVTQPVCQLCERVGRQGCHHVHIGPPAQLYVQDRVAHCLPGPPLVLVPCYGPHSVWQLLLLEKVQG